jgi:hypothetical protein
MVINLISQLLHPLLVVKVKFAGFFFVLFCDFAKTLLVKLDKLLNHKQLFVILLNECFKLRLFQLILSFFNRVSFVVKNTDVSFDQHPIPQNRVRQLILKKSLACNDLFDNSVFECLVVLL